jgi:phospholipid/cholesterol/gamma-HCH transport system substrate-binding protein
MRFSRNRPAMLDERATAARNRRRGIVALAVIIASLAVTGLAYVNPAGKTGYTAHLATAAGIRPGDEVRIAGIKVGKVSAVRLDHTVVEMKFEVQHSVFVGSESTLDIKLLTPLGGHYVALDPKGDMPLGRNVLPEQRTTVPFEISDIVQAATPLVKEVDGQVIHDTFTEVANAANRYPNALRDVISSAYGLTESLSEMTTDFHKSLDFANNAFGAVIAGRKQIITLTEQLALLGRTYTANSVNIVDFFTLLSELTRILDRAMVFYGREVAPIVNGIDDIIDTLVAHPDRLGQAAIELGQIDQIVWPMLSGNGVVIDESHQLVPGQDLCLPNIMKRC